MQAEGALMKVYRTLRHAFGHRSWWPAETPFEVMVGAVLTQNTNWQNVEKAINNLKQAGLLSPSRLAAASGQELESLIRPTGYYRQKSRRLNRLARWACENAGDAVLSLADWPADRLRQELLGLRGIGPETADSILLYALGKPVFVVDGYTMRVLRRHQLIPADCTYYELQSYLQERLPCEVDLYQDYHAQFVEVGKRFCRKQPLCEGCPLLPVMGRPVLEETG